MNQQKQTSQPVTARHSLKANTRHEAETYRQISLRDMAQQKGVTLNLHNDQLPPETPLVSGHFCHTELRNGLFLHSSDATEACAFSVDATHQAGLSCIFFLQGTVKVTIGGRLFSFDDRCPQRVNAAAIIKTTEESFRRGTKGPQQVRHLVITATPAWLQETGLTETAGERTVTRLFNQHMRSHQWHPEPRLCKLIQELLNPPALAPELASLYQESRAIDVIVEVLGALLQTDHIDTARPTLGYHDRLRLRRAQEVLDANLNQPLSVPFIARETGTSPRIALHSVVLPMPLRPTSASTPPSRFRSTPCSACEAP